MIRNTNLRAVQPLVFETILEVEVNSTEASRGALTHTLTASGTSVINLPWMPTNPHWVEIYVDGFRVVNMSTDFESTYESFSISDQTITFTIPISGEVLVVCDARTCPPFADENLVEVRNEQGALGDGSGPTPKIATYCEPIILSQPPNGYARLTDDRMSIMYMPDLGFNGTDSFSYSVFTQRGQLADPKCVFVQVGEPI